jgi:membrane associated rhomboid family serine protease
MASWDAPSRLVGPPGWRALRPVTRATLVLTAAGYLGSLLWIPFAGLFAAVPSLLFPGLQLWRLLTWPLVVLGIWNVLFGLLLFWSFGSELEPEWGTRRYSAFLLLSAAAGGVLGTAVALLLRSSDAAGGAGPSGLLTAVIVAWALRGPGLPVSFFGVLPMTRRVFALLAVGLLAFGELDAARLLPGAVVAARLAFALGALPVAWLFAGRRGGPGGLSRLDPGRLLRRRRFRVVEGSRDWRVH